MKISKLFSWFPAKPNTQQSPMALAPKSGITDLKLMFFIVEWNRVKIISDSFEKEKAGFFFMSKGRGTATSEILDLLGIGAGNKAVITCLEQPEMVPVLLKDVRRKLGHHSHGAGIAFTVPLSGINSPLLRIFKQPAEEKNTAELGLNVRGQNVRSQTEFSHALIISAVNKGYSDDFMNTARAAGAGGGTVLKARGQAHERAVKFLGISVQDEKELILILANREKQEPIMRAVCKTHGINSKAQGVVFSLPVDKVMSLSFEQALNA
jgi:nitrogen regulatory protein PII